MRLSESQITSVPTYALRLTQDIIMSDPYFNFSDINNYRFLGVVL